MADEVQYPLGTDSNKRKYEDSTPTPPSSGRRTTGFSGPITSASPDSAPSYNSVPPPVDEIQLAKQRVQMIAARLVSDAEAKRPRTENGVGFDSEPKGFSSAPPDYGQKSLGSQIGVAPSAIPASYGYQGTSKKIDIPNGRVGVIIGKGGETIKYLQLQSGARIQVTRDMDADPNSPTRMVELMGTPEQIAKAEQLINEVLSEAESGDSGIVSRRLTGSSGSDSFTMKVSNNKVGLLIGKGGETIKNLQVRSGARIQVIPLHLPPGDTSIERTVHIDGTSEQIESAKQLINEVTSENRVRNPSMGGGYPQQGYQARPPVNWGPPGPPQMQQSGYGYVQPGAYPGSTPQYNMPPPPYGGYPPQPAAGGYSSSWDQTTAQGQQTAQGGAYDYYNQQSAQQQQQAPGGPPTPADNSGYNYSQPPSAYSQPGQGYSQDGYGGGYHAPPPQPGYGQPQQGYDQQGYNSAAGYATSTQEAHTQSYGAQGDGGQTPAPAPAGGQQGYGAGQQPSPSPGSYPQPGSQAGYGMPPTSQAGYASQPMPAQSGYGPNYGAPQGQKPPTGQPVYGAQQSPSAGGGYGQPPLVQPGYPHSQAPPSQTGYAQPDSGLQRGPPPTYATAGQLGYGPPYGAPPSQPGYGQPPAYNSSYGGGYSQPHSTDGAAGGSSHGAYDAAGAPASGVGAAPAAQQGGAAKTSPQS
ncbi:K Homology domain, type 1 [Dillenia turbinata]|uniref:K Homology domain, type 1 n=1 Tax=Dillenia turbinata TaxID=194707 RepID=A0AAN8YU71_9MAGN